MSITLEAYAVFYDMFACPDSNTTSQCVVPQHTTVHARKKASKSQPNQDSHKILTKQYFKFYFEKSSTWPAPSKWNMATENGP